MRKCNRIPRYSLGEMATKPAALTHIDTSKLPDWVGPKNSIDFNNIASKIGGYAGAANNVIGSITDSIAGAKMGQKPSVAGTLGKMGSLAAAGMSVGGPWGAAAGAAAGLILGTMGSKGKVDKTTGDVTEPSGWLGMGVNKHALYKEGTRIQNSNLAQQIGQQYALQAAQNDDQNDFTMAAYGDDGIDTSLAYLDDGELIRTPDGSIQGIPEQGKPTDSNLINVPVGTQVLSDKLKVPGTKYTFAQMGKKLMRIKQSSGTDKYAQNSDQLNQQNNHKMYSQLIALQEQVKQQKQAAQQGIPAYSDGTTYTGSNTTISDKGSWANTILPFLIKKLQSQDKGKINDLITEWNRQQAAHANLFNKFGNNMYSSDAVKRYQTDWNAFGGNAPIWASRQAGNVGSVANPTSGDNSVTGGVDSVWGDWTKFLRHRGMGQEELDQLLPYLKGLGIDGYLENNHVMLRMSQPRTALPVPEPQQQPQPKATAPTMQPTQVIPEQEQYKLKKKPDYITAATNLYTLGSAADAYANVPKPKTYNPNIWTPQYGPTDYNINPQLEQVALTDSINRYNIQNVNPNTGANMAMALQSGMNRDNTISSLYAQKFNAENDMKFKNAGIYNQWAPDIVNRYDKADEINAQRNDNYIKQRSAARANMVKIMQEMNRDRLQRNKDAAYTQAVLPKMSDNMPLSYVRNVFTPLGYNVIPERR